MKLIRLKANVFIFKNFKPKLYLIIQKIYIYIYNIKKIYLKIFIIIL